MRRRSGRVNDIGVTAEHYAHAAFDTGADALTLVEKEALRGFGDGPYGLVIDTEHVPPDLGHDDPEHDDRHGRIDAAYRWWYCHGRSG